MGIRSIADAEFVDGLVIQFPLFVEIFLRCRILGELFHEEFLCDLMDAFDLLFLILPIVMFFRIYLIFREIDIPLLSQFLRRIPEIYPLYLLHEGDDIPAFAAAEAFEDLFGRRYHEGWRLLVVEWTVTGEISPCSPERDVSADNVYDIDGG